ncbi:hypothetical protein EUX98_g5688 [Antrodiella citrinella]|uniref:Uncharacterized protein n=1 Tax=Antrodiella citrinella TaxID=2447956 RepID=A0A4S4MYL8_9APHY|nr:hypothetical protein EUX98_g5688 [Antrodiella citrinella]
MEGLEQDPEFWHKFEAPDDDAHEEEDVPMIDLTKSPGSRRSKNHVPPKALASTTQKPKNATTLPSDLSESQTIRRLANGKFACNHLCKDKTKCKHLCCREGLDRPPPWTKRRVEKTFGTEDSAYGEKKAVTKDNADVQQIHDEDAQPKLKLKAKTKPSHKPDSRLVQLEHLHRSTHVKDRLSLPEGQRIKVEDSEVSFSQAKSRPKPNFNLNFTDLNEGRKPAPTQAALPDIDDDDSALPDPSDFLASNRDSEKKLDSQHAKSATPSTSYSDPEVDSFIGKVSLDNGATTTRAVSSAKTATGPRSEVELITPPPRKRIKTNYRVETPFSRQCHVSPVYADREFESIEPAQVSRQVPTDHYTPPGLQDGEEFILDTSLFVIRPARSPAKAARSRSSSPEVKLVTPPPRKRVKLDNDHAQKRKKETVLTQSRFSAAEEFESCAYSPEPAQELLFLQGSSSSVAHYTPPGGRHGEEFVLDTSLFEVRPPSTQVPSSHNFRSPLSSKASQLPTKIAEKPNPPAQAPPISYDEDEEVPTYDFLAEFEAWTRSGRVIITDEQQD